MSLGPTSSKAMDLTWMSRAGTCTTFWMLIREMSMKAMLYLSRLNISTLSFGMTGLLNFIDPEPTNLEA